jgi:hypothetical protein
MASTIDKIVPAYVWFVYGFGTVQLPLGIVSLVVTITTLITVKGIYIPMWMLPVSVLIITVFCTILGYLMTKHGIWNKTTSYANRAANPEISRMCKDLEMIKEHLGIKEE